MIHSFKIKLLLAFLSMPLFISSCSTEPNQYELEASRFFNEALGYISWDKQNLFFVPEGYKKEFAEFLKNQASNSPENNLIFFIQDEDTKTIIYQQTASGQTLSESKLTEIITLISPLKSIKLAQEKPTLIEQPFSIKMPALFKNEKQYLYYGAISEMTFKESLTATKKTQKYILVSLEAAT